MLRNTNHTINSYFWLLNQLPFLQKSNIDIIYIQIFAASYAQVTAWAKFMKRVQKFKISTINQTNLNNCLTSSVDSQKKLNPTVLIILKNLTMKFWRKFVMDSSLHSSHMQNCNWVWKQCNALLVNCNLLSHYWNKVSQLTFLQKNNTDIFSFLKNSYLSNKKSFSVVSMILYLWETFHTLGKIPSNNVKFSILIQYDLNY